MKTKRERKEKERRNKEYAKKKYFERFCNTIFAEKMIASFSRWKQIGLFVITADFAGSRQIGQIRSSGTASRK